MHGDKGNQQRQASVQRKRVNNGIEESLCVFVFLADWSARYKIEDEAHVSRVVSHFTFQFTIDTPSSPSHTLLYKLIFGQFHE